MESGLVWAHQQQYCPGGQGGSWSLAVLRWRAGARDGAEIKEAFLRRLEAGHRVANDPLLTNLVEEMGLFSCRGCSLKCKQIPMVLYTVLGGAGWSREPPGNLQHKPQSRQKVQEERQVGGRRLWGRGKPRPTARGLQMPLAETALGMGRGSPGGQIRPRPTLAQPFLQVTGYLTDLQFLHLDCRLAAKEPAGRIPALPFSMHAPEA